ncbi:hypothetical protein [Vibrio coralliilyticus]|uniref:hypothetical protein n=1 Tax=Vibrio coralliilyticus TaxID=190893 RepID=UPI002FD1E5F3
MKLFASILTTAVITGSVWGLVVLQPAMADSTQQAQINNEFSDVSHDVKRGDTPQQYLRGVTKTISLESLPSLWREFDSKLVESDKLPDNLDRIVVLYQELNSDFTEAQVTIGYPTEKSPLASDLVALPAIEQAELLMHRGQHSESELMDAWGRINFQKSVDALVEIHYLNSQGQPESSQLSVYYK